MHRVEENLARRSRRLPAGGRHHVLGALIAATLLLGSCATSQPSAFPSPKPLPTQHGCTTMRSADSLCILVLGDSLGVGAPLNGDDRWWMRLRPLLEARLPGRSISIDNWAVSGSHVDVLESAARDQPELGTYDVAIVIEGVNDVFVMPVDAWRPRYEAAITQLEARGLTVVITAPPPLFENGAFGNLFDATAEVVRTLAAGQRPLLDIAARWHADGAPLAATYYVDWIHQGSAGQALMATMARDVVLKAIGAL
jgi:lysophospholipase L1-like esterase